MCVSMCACTRMRTRVQVHACVDVCTCVCKRQGFCLGGQVCSFWVQLCNPLLMLEDPLVVVRPALKK